MSDITQDVGHQEHSDKRDKFRAHGYFIAIVFLSDIFNISNYPQRSNKTRIRICYNKCNEDSSSNLASFYLQKIK
ncbi:hypothetical protein A3I34_02765 [Candidatus Jorgensenbacteria bacterium RIFCSPLOWO2_02_FULL_45_12]|uniref:Uncharacterized protein n=1 Tax=Candidatus Jorgensenbacteria bacterium RIFCSPHIGHO2_02_FULL_45_20 TaxID=1798470 RepID=A0A1F6BPA2_9BACT|nr:MAG: hypothetical protein A3D55_01925 [Candidatus Jorgensenbacteria bacterium RIFCSPHIGHO2_02_FULL_45_20]OGG42540.1 MAG: hypothetical protein A3I34_02765 [Candidatus Jorgensenbacteria bacterium RIFCSPLOWO2_02_FULL_45_12]